MPEPIPRRGAIAAAVRPRGIRLAERTGLGKLDLRCDPTDRATMAGIGRVLDLALPIQPCTSVRGPVVTALWLGPDQWLLTCPAAEVGPLLGALRGALGGAHAALTDLTDGRVAFRLAGPDARDVLAKGCPLDLHPRMFRPGSCAQSLLAKAAVLIHLPDDDPSTAPAFDVFVGRSFAHYLWSWLEDAGREYGVQVAAP